VYFPLPKSIASAGFSSSWIRPAWKSEADDLPDGAVSWAVVFSPEAVIKEDATISMGLATVIVGVIAVMETEASDGEATELSDLRIVGVPMLTLRETIDGEAVELDIICGIGVPKVMETDNSDGVAVELSLAEVDAVAVPTEREAETRAGCTVAPAEINIDGVPEVTDIFPKEGVAVASCEEEKAIVLGNSIHGFEAVVSVSSSGKSAAALLPIRMSAL